MIGELEGRARGAQNGVDGVDEVNAKLVRDLAAGAALGAVLDELVRAVEHRAPGVTASVMLVEGGLLKVGAAPNLPEGYNRASDSHPVGEGHGSCGTAAHRGELVVVADIQADPLWKNYRDIARRYRLGACWSMPIFSPQRSVVGTFALYSAEPRRPQQHELRLAEDFAQLAGLAIQSHRVREGLQASEEAFRRLVDDLDGIVWDAPADTRQFSSVSGRAESMLGYPVARWCGEPGFWESIIHPEDREATVRRQREAVHRDGRHESEYRVLTADGRIVWIRDLVYVRTDPGSLRRHLRGVMLDISRQRAAEQEREELLVRLGDQQGLLRAAIEEIPAAVMIATADGRMALVNREARRILPAEAAADPQGPLARALRGGAIVDGEEMVMAGPDGERRTLAARAAPVRDGRGEVVAAVAAFSDISARKQVDADHRLLAEAGSMLGTLLEPEATARALAALAVRHLADWCVVFLRRDDGSVHCAALAPDRASAAAELDRLSEQPGGIPFRVASLLAGGPALLFSEIDVQAFDPGAARPQLLQLVRGLGAESAMAVPLRVHTRTLGAVVYVSATPRRYGPEDLLVAEELARRSALALENSGLYHDAQAAIRQREEFLSIAAHELRTPVASLQLTVQTIALAVKSLAPDLELLRGRAQAGERLGLRLARLIDELLDVSIVRAGRLRLWPEEIDLVAIIQAVLARLGEDLARKQIDVAIHAPREMIGRWDPLRVEQVFTNLLSNAIKYGEGRPVSITLTPGPETITVHVEDRGMGMTAQVVSRLFNPFERGVSAGHYGGLGLGLYITDQIVRAHGGTLSVRSTPGEGSTFMVELPLRAASVLGAVSHGEHRPSAPLT